MSQFFSENLVDLPEFLLFFVVATVMTVVFAFVYSAITRHNELALIRENSIAAAIAFTGSLVGFALPLASAMLASHNIVEVLIWGGVALIVQVAVYYLVSLPMPGISKRITDGEIAAGVWLGGASLVGGILNAASMAN